MFERFTPSARLAVEDAKYEAARRGDRRIGTEHLLLALLQEDELAQLVGADSEAAHDRADELDRAALAAIGVELGGYRPQGRASVSRMAPFTSGAKALMGQALAKAAAEKAKSITSRHFLLALLDLQAPDPADALLAALAVDRPALRARLTEAA
ncbi:MAG: Clp protease [Frondihabitans sp.]|nr:Clp protease [Frondihabitans sp.]